MKRPSLIALLVAQTLLLFAVAWAGVYFARDEFLLATGRQAADDDEGLAKAAAITEDDGVPTVRLSAAAQRNVGIEVALPEPAQRGRDAAVPVTVLDAQPLIDLQGRLRAARHEADAARALAAASAAERQRVQGLFDDDRNASQRALEAATAQAAADAARERSAQAALRALREGARAGWGATLAQALQDERGGLIERLAGGRAVLLQAAVRGDASVAPGDRLLLPMPGRAEPVLATPLGSAGPALAAEAGGGRGLLFHAPGAGLVTGQRLTAQWRGADAALQAGVLVPAAALVWHAGQPWIYVLETNEPQAVSVSKAARDEDAAPAGVPTSAAAPARSAAASRAGATGSAAAPGAGAAASTAASADVPTSAAAPAPSAAASTASAAAPATSGADDGATTAGRFQRRAVPHARRVGAQWFLPGYAEDDAVVVQGAQLLLSEELKFQIRNENDD